MISTASMRRSNLHLINSLNITRKILLGGFNAKVAKPTIGNESLHKTGNDDVVRVVNFATSKNFTGKSTMWPHCNIHKYT
jgi:hypothetical protein